MQPVERREKKDIVKDIGRRLNDYRDQRDTRKTLIAQIEDAKASIDIFMTVREEYELSLARGEEISGIPPSYAKWYW